MCPGLGALNPHKKHFNTTLPTPASSRGHPFRVAICFTQERRNQTSTRKTDLDALRDPLLLLLAVDGGLSERGLLRVRSFLPSLGQLSRPGEVFVFALLGRLLLVDCMSEVFGNGTGEEAVGIWRGAVDCLLEVGQGLSPPLFAL